MISFLLLFGSVACSTDSSDDGSSDKSDNNVNPSNPSNPDTPSSGGNEIPTTGDVSNVTVEIVKSEGWLNSAYIIFKQIDGATYKVLCDDKELDSPLIRYYDTYTYYENSDDNGQTKWEKKTLSKVVRADALGLAAGDHIMKVAAVGTENTSDYSTSSMKVVDHDRSGFAFTGSKTPGAYKADGTLKDNAIVLYVTAATAKTVSYTAEKGVNASASATYTGLQDVLSESSLKKLTVPLCIRIVGTIRKADVDSLGSSEEGLQIKTTSENGVTVEGVGHDAAVYGFGFLIREAKYTEVCNLGVYNFMDDGISVDTNNSYLWIHNNDISYGAVGSDSDQAKGDGSLDFKKSYYSTLSYNHFWDSGKCNLLDASAGSSGSNYLSYHHNWYDHSDSRHPRIRNATAVHVYNNYYDGNAKYGIGVTSGSSCFAEGNYFRDANDPMMSSLQGTDATGSGTFSGEEGGTIKAWNNFVGYNTANTVHFVTNKWRYSNNAYGEAAKTAMGEPETHTTTLGTANTDGTYTLYSWSYGDEFPSFITKNEATDKGASDSTKPYYQVSKGKTAFTLSVPSNASKVVITAKSASSGVSSVTVKVSGVSQSVTDDNYPEYTFDVSSVSSESLAIVAGSEGSLNIKSIKVIAPTGWETTYTTGVALNDIDAYEVASRSETVPASVKTKSGLHTYSNFDTTLGDSGMGIKTVPTSPEQAKADVMMYAGRHNPDFAYQFDNAKDDKDYGVNDALKTLVVNYTTGMTKIQGEAASSSGGENPVNPDPEPDPTPETPETPATTGETTLQSVTAPASWLATESIPNWLGGVTGSSTTNASYNAFGLTSYYSVAANGTISLTPASACTVKIYIAGNNNTANKGTVTAKIGETQIGSTYSLPARKNASATPFTFDVSAAQAGSTIVVTTSYASFLYKVEVLASN